jgi:hypothetical protein
MNRATIYHYKQNNKAQRPQKQQQEMRENLIKMEGTKEANE